MKRIFHLIVAIISGLAVSEKAKAVLGANPSKGLFVDYISNDANNVVMRLTSMLLAVAGSVAMLYLIIGGFYYMLSGANEDLAKKGKMYVKNSIIGLIIIVLSYTIVSVVYRELT